jgi:hypothetical protein
MFFFSMKESEYQQITVVVEWPTAGTSVATAQTPKTTLNLSLNRWPRPAHPGHYTQNGNHCNPKPTSIYYLRTFKEWISITCIDDVTCVEGLSPSPAQIPSSSVISRASLAGSPSLLHPLSPIFSLSGFHRLRHCSADHRIRFSVLMDAGRGAWLTTRRPFHGLNSLRLRITTTVEQRRGSRLLSRVLLRPATVEDNSPGTC